MPGRYDVVIAGAGIAGLSLAVLLSTEGRYSVLLLESGSAPGGRFRVVERDGYLLDWGVHACLLGSRGAIGNVLRRCGSPVRIRPAGMAVFRDGRLLPFVGERLLSVLGQKVLKAASLARFGSAALTVRGKPSYDITVSGWLGRNRSGEDLESALKALSIGLLATDRYDRASAGELFAFFRQVMRRGVAAGYPEGGWRPVLDALLETVKRSRRCEIRLNTRLGRVMAPGNRVEGVTAGGEDIEAGAVVCAFPPQSLAGEVNIDPPLPDEYRHRLSSLEESVGLCIEMGLSRPVTGERRIAFSVDPPALLWAVSNASPAVAPPGKQLLQFFSPIDKEKRDDRAFIAKRTGELLELVAEAFGASPDEEFRRVMVTTIGGVVPFAGQSRPHRPGIDVPGYDGLFIIGDGVNAGGLGGDLAARSAIVAEPMVADYLDNRAG
ncbi:MAG: FAD-dependent oxidoreductase [Actinobacteria bacterium]|nr:FAD-dependent oxidoreductase [Actinomycetota bacterium]